MGATERSEAARRSEARKSALSPDRSLKPDSVKLESLVIADSVKLESLVIAHQHGAVNTFPGLVHTARHTIRVERARSREPDRKGGRVEGSLREGGEVVTR